MNDAVRRAWDIALARLAPTQAQLQHGLELHADAVVFDAYGFSPRAALDGDLLACEMEAGASDLELQDLGEEMTMTRAARDDAECAEFQAAWEQSGVTCIFQNAGEEGQDPIRMMKRLARFTYVTDFMSDFIRKAVVPEDIAAAKAAGKRALYFTANGVAQPQQWTSVEEELGLIRIFFQLGIRMMHLTYNRRNMIGDGCAEPANGGLSDFGRAVVAEMNRVGVIVDTAHSGWQTSLEAARASSLPMVASHSGCVAVNEHHRCKPDHVIRAVCDTGGFIGICCVPSFLGRSGDINALLDHIDHVVRHFGAEHVAIGTDVAYTSSRYAEEARKLPPRRRSRTPFRSFWAPDDALFASRWQDPEMQQSLAWTNWPLYTVGLVQRGYSDDEIRKILGGNVLRVAGAVLQAAGHTRRGAK